MDFRRKKRQDGSYQNFQSVKLPMSTTKLRTAPELDRTDRAILRALQREWMEYANSEDYQSLPNTALDAAEEEERGVRRKRRADTDIISVRPAPSPAEILAAHRYYHAAYGGEVFEAKG